MIGLFDGEFAIFDDYLVYEVKYFVFLIVCQANYLILWTVALIFWRTFHFGDEYLVI